MLYNLQEISLSEALFFWLQKFSDVAKKSFLPWRLAISYQTNGLLDPLLSSEVSFLWSGQVSTHTIYYDNELGFASLGNCFIQAKSCSVGSKVQFSWAECTNPKYGKIIRRYLRSQKRGKPSETIIDINETKSRDGENFALFEAFIVVVKH